MTYKIQAIPADQEDNGVGQGSMPTTLLQNNTRATYQWAFMLEDPRDMPGVTGRLFSTVVWWKHKWFD